MVGLAGAGAHATGESPTSPLRQEAVGLELNPVAVFRSDNPPWIPDDSGVHFGLGGSVRLLRHRWNGGYWTPLQAGLFLGGAGFTGEILAQVMTEGGAVLRLRDLTLEMGLGVGAAILAIRVANGCDGSCSVGGEGAFISPVLRVLFHETTPYTLGIAIRGEVPLSTPHGEVFGTYVGYGATVLAGLDVAYGR
jgi:hypothetical protein